MISGQEQGLTSGDKALDALARFEDKEDLESLKSILWFCLHSDWIVREHALTLLQRKSLSFSLFAGRSLLYDPAPLVREGAILCLVQKKTHLHTRLIYGMLTDVNWTVRCEAAMCLAEMPVTYSLESIVAVYLAEEDEFVRRDLAYLIGKTKSTARANTLRELLNTEQEPIARVGLLATLHKLGEKDVLDPMLEYYNHEDRMLHRNLTNTFWDLNFTVKEKRHIVSTVSQTSLHLSVLADYRKLIDFWKLKPQVAK